MTVRARSAIAHAQRVVSACLLVLGCIVHAGCSSPTPIGMLDARTTTGAPVREMLAEDRPTVILHYPASYCFACAQSVSEWQELDRAGSVKLVVLLADEPSEGARRALAVRRIATSGILSGLDGRRVPGEYLIENGVVQVSAHGAAETGRSSPVLAAIRERVRPSR